MLGFTAAQNSYDTMVQLEGNWERIEQLKELYADEIDADFIANHLHDFIVDNGDHLSDSDFFDLVSIEFSKCSYWFDLVGEYTNMAALEDLYADCAEDFIAKMEEDY